jgi:flagellar FliJ protein
MKRFTFSLEKVLELRQFSEQEAKIELGRAVGILNELERRLEDLAHERSRAAAEQFSPGNSAAMIQQYMIYLLRLDNTKEELPKEAALAAQKVEEARELFIEASRELKVMEKLKEKREKEYKKEYLTEEGRAADDTYRRQTVQN